MLGPGTIEFPTVCKRVRVGVADHEKTKGHSGHDLIIKIKDYILEY